MKFVDDDDDDDDDRRWKWRRLYLTVCDEAREDQWELHSIDMVQHVEKSE